MGIDGASRRRWCLTVAVLVGSAVGAALLTRSLGPSLARQATESPALSLETSAPCADLQGHEVDVTSAEELASALERARPGDVILLADGVYPGQFVIAVSGTPDAPITLCGSRRAALDHLYEQLAKQAEQRGRRAVPKRSPRDGGVAS